MSCAVIVNSPSCEGKPASILLNRGCIGRRPDRPMGYTVWSTLEPLNEVLRIWAGVIQAVLPHLAIPSTAVDGVEQDDEVDEDDDGDDGPTRCARMRCRSKPTGEQRRATRGAGRLPGLLVGPGPSVNGPRSGTRPGFGVARRATWPYTWSGRCYMLISCMHTHM
jgi:hypothetical protein